MSETNFVVGVVLPQQATAFSTYCLARLQQEEGISVLTANAAAALSSTTLLIDLAGTVSGNDTALPLLRPSFIDATGVHSESLILHAHQQEHDTFTIAVLDVHHPERVYAEGRFRLLNYAKEKNLHLCSEGMYHLLLDSCKRLLNGVASHTATLTRTPHTTQGRSIPGYALKKIRHLMHVLFYRDCWNCGIVDAPPDVVAFEGIDKYPVTWMEEAPGSDFKADPFGLHDAETDLFLYEYYRAAEDKGILDVFANNSLRANIFSDVHLSYPYLFKHTGEIYCLPEQSRAGKLELWKLNNAGEPTEKVVLLHNFAAVDASIVFHEERWWIFCTNAANKGADLRLHLFYADTLTGPWKPHAQNPVRTDIIGARPGGSFFVRDGKLHRPAQDSSKGYGSSLIIYRIDVLTPENYAETAVGRVTPDAKNSYYGKGLHTLSAYGSQTLIDGKRIKFRPFHFLTRR